MKKNDIINYFKSLNEQQKFNWICSLMIKSLQKKTDERYSIPFYRQGEKSLYFYHESRTTFIKKVIKTYNKPTQNKFNAIVAEVFKTEGFGIYYTETLYYLNYLNSYIYSYFAHKMLEKNDFKIKPSRYLREKEDCISSFIEYWLSSNNKKNENDLLLELKNLSLDFNEEFWSEKGEIYIHKEPETTKANNPKATPEKTAIYNNFIREVQAGNLPSIESAIISMQISDGKVDGLFAPMEKESPEPKIKEDKLRSIPKYLKHPVFESYDINLTYSQYNDILKLIDEDNIYYIDNNNVKQKTNIKLVKINHYEYNFLNISNDKPIAFLDFSTQYKDLKYILRYFENNEECESGLLLHRLYNMNIEIY